MTIFFKGYHWYIAKFFTVNVIIIGLLFLITFITLFFYAVKTKVFFHKDVFPVLSGIVIIIVYLLLKKYLISTKRTYYFSGSTLIVGFSVFGFAYALAARFNREFEALKKLQDSLEEEVQNRTRELNQARLEIEEINRRRTNFFINLAHETRTPLTLITNYLSLYMEKHKGEELDIMKSNITKLSDDIINFMDSEKILSGFHIYEHDAPINISESIKDTLKLFYSYAAIKNINIKNNCNEDKYIFCDSSAFERVIRNIVMNAVKYSGENTTITLSTAESPSEISVAIKDNGKGIPEDKIVNLSEPFYQISGNKENYQGMGMGLFITRSIISEAGGSFNISSAPGEGTIVTLSFRKANVESVKNIEKSENPDILSAGIQENTQSDKVIKNENKDMILIVEDNRDLRILLEKQLGENYRVYSAVNGKEALLILESECNIKCIISDIMMDEMDGVTLFNSIRKRIEFEDIPFIFLTAKTALSDKIENISNGAIDYISKPFDMGLLKLKISSVISHDSLVRKKTISRAVSSLQDIISGEKKEISKPVKDLTALKEHYKLTDREMEIISLIKEGCEYKEIGHRLSISPRTVVRHTQNIFEKTTVHNKLELINLLY